MTAVDLSALVADFTWYYPVVLGVHRGRVFAVGAIDTQFRDEQVILPAGAIPAAMRPAADTIVILHPYYTAGTPLVKADSLYRPYRSIVGADGSWAMEEPFADADSGAYVMGFTRRAEVTLLLDASWASADTLYADDHPGGQDVGPYLSGASGWTDAPGNPTYFRYHPDHGSVVHVEGALDVADNPGFGGYVVVGLPEFYAPFFTTTPSVTGIQAAIRLQGDYATAALVVLVNNPFSPTEVLAFPDSSRIGGSSAIVFGGGGSHRVAGNTNLVTPQIAAPTQALTFHHTSSLSCPYALYGGSPSPYVAGPIAAPPSPPPVDLAALIDAMNFDPDWVTIKWSVGAQAAYEGHNSCPANDPYSDIAHDDTSGYGHEYGYTPAVSGVSNRKFATAEASDPTGAGARTSMHWDAAGPQVTMPYDSENVFGPGPYFTSGGETYLAPPTQQYHARGLVEAAGLEHSQLLWRPGDVGDGTTEIFGDGRRLTGTITWEVCPFYENGSHYLVAGDVLRISSTYPAMEPDPVVTPPGPTPSTVAVADAVSGTVEH